MALREHFETSGLWLFRWRSYLPLLLFIVVLLGLRDYRYFGDSHQQEMLWELFCFCVGLLGLLIRSYAIGHAYERTSGRVTRKQEADALNTTGLYSVVRHPLYLGNYFMWIAPALLTRAFWVPLIVTLAFWLFYERVMAAEEAYIRGKFGSQFDEWANRTPAFVPAFRHWVSPATRFDAMRVMQSEKSSQLGLVFTFTLLNMLIVSDLPERAAVDGIWLVLLAASLVFYMVMSTLRKLAKRRVKRETAASSAAGLS